MVDDLRAVRETLCDELWGWPEQSQPLSTFARSYFGAEGTANDFIMVEVSKAIVGDLSMLQNHSKDLGVTAPKDYEASIFRFHGLGRKTKA